MSIFAIGIIFIAAILAVRSGRSSQEATAAEGRQPSRSTPGFSELEVTPTSEEILEQLCSRSDQ